MKPKRAKPLLVYDPSHPDAPKFWADEASPDLAEAFEQYLRAPSAMTARDIDLMRIYLRHWVCAPVWPDSPGLEALRASVDQIRTPRDLVKWLHAGEDEGLAPL